MSLLEKLRTMRSSRNEQMQLQHGWEVELVCPKCGTVAQPVFNGWTRTIELGSEGPQSFMRTSFAQDAMPI